MSRKVYVAVYVFVTLLILGSAFYYLPYYVTKPGMAKELAPIIEVAGGDQAEGSFMLTTVRMGQANIYSYVLAKWSKYQEIYAEASVRSEDETDQEYNVRQLHLMDNAKHHAIKVAYEKAGKRYSYQYLGVYVLDVHEDMPANDVLQAGDQIIQVDDLRFQSSRQFIDYIATKKAGDQVQIVYTREETKKKATITLQPFKDYPKQVGLGITPDDYTRVTTDPKITIDSDQIGGPSAGLMFSLEIYNQLTAGDLTKGYAIAGTGTIDEAGKVGPIGGIEQKIVAADKSGADLFFAPNEDGAIDSNYHDALVAAKDIDTTMKIIPVDSFDEAVTYLEQVKEK